MERDRLGRRRSPEQERGLRPLHPLLPEEWVSKALRVAMSRIRLGFIRGAGGSFRGCRADTRTGLWDGFIELTRSYLSLLSPSRLTAQQHGDLARYLDPPDRRSISIAGKWGPDVSKRRINHNARRESVSRGPIRRCTSGNTVRRRRAPLRCHRHRPAKQALRGQPV